MRVGQLNEWRAAENQTDVAFGGTRRGVEERGPLLIGGVFIIRMGLDARQVALASGLDESSPVRTYGRGTRKGGPIRGRDGGS